MSSSASSRRNCETGESGRSRIKTRRPIIEKLKLIGCEVETLQDFGERSRRLESCDSQGVSSSLWMEIQGDGPDNLKEEIARLLRCPVCQSYPNQH